MTSGTFESVDIDFIWVDRANRQRRELSNIEELAESIHKNGLIHPPVIRRDGQLIVGERRLTALRSLGWTSVPIQWVDELDELELHALEFEENIARSDLSWQDQAQAVAKYHDLRLRQDPTWTENKTAERLGIGQQTVNDKRSVAKELDAGNVSVISAPKFSTARSIVTRKNARAKASAMDSIVEQVSGKKVERIAPLINEDFHDWAASFTGTPFNFLHCDFPYGVGMHKSDQGGGTAFGTYMDSADVYWSLLDTLRGAMGTVVAGSAHLMFWFSMDYYEITREALTAMGWKVNPFPLIWIKDDNTGIIPDAKRGPRRIYETAFFASRGDRLIAAPVSNAFSAPGREKSIHMNEKPVAMLRHFMRMFVDEYSRVLDPTAGSGNALKAATLLGAPTVLGIERDTEFFNRAKEAYFSDESIPALNL